MLDLQKELQALKAKACDMLNSDELIKIIGELTDIVLEKENEN